MTKKLLLLFVFTCILTGLFGFDGNRKGFLLGFGGGLAQVNFKQKIEDDYDSIESDDESETAFATDFKIGYAPTNQLELYYTSKVAWFSINNINDDDVTIADGIGVIGLSYFFAPELKSGAWHSSLFLSGGFGLSSWSTPMEEDDDPWEGTGYFLGVGYEFTKHYRVSIDYFANNPSIDEMGLTFTTTSNVIMLTFSGMAF